jgi:hypothetical protein
MLRRAVPIAASPVETVLGNGFGDRSNLSEFQAEIA